MQAAELAILNANVVTLNPKQPTAEAIAIREGKIVDVNSNTKIRRILSADTKIIDAEQKTVIPGLVDCHIHMTKFGQALRNLELRNTQSIEEVQEKLKEYAEKNPGKKWILGGQWDQELFSEKRYPTRWDLDEAVVDRPVFLLRVCGHIGVANSEALKLSGITKETVIEGGKVDLDTKTGQPTGLLRENALKLVWKAIAKPTLEELKQTCTSACSKAVEAGLTCVHWMTNSPDEIRIIQKLATEKKLPLRIYLGIPIEFLPELVALGLETGFGNDKVKIGFVKILADGSLGGHTAALKEPYNDRPDTKGMMLYTQEELERLILEAHKSGLQLAVHAIGDHTIEAVLNAFEKALAKFPSNNHRHRIEHCSVLNPDLIKQMKQLGLMASVQPHFVPSDFWVTDRVGKTRARWVYPFKTLLHDGLVVASGSDCPVEPINPVLGIWAAAARTDNPEEELTVEEALRTYTVNAAYASFDENKRGTIEAGKYADLTILSEDPIHVSKDQIRKIEVEMTIVDGDVVYAKPPRNP